MQFREFCRGLEEIESSVFLTNLERCLDTAHSGTSQVVTHGGQPHAVVVSMSEYALLLQYKELLRQVGQDVLSEHISQAES